MPTDEEWDAVTIEPHDVTGDPDNACDEGWAG